MKDVRAWILNRDLEKAAVLLDADGPSLAGDILGGMLRLDARTLNGIVATAAWAISAYDTESGMKSAMSPNFNSWEFVHSSDTVYITAGAQGQASVAPLVVGLLEDIRQATFMRARLEATTWPPVFWALDEVANIAPIPNLPSVVSEGGGQGLQVLACLQDLSQARARWGEAARGFLTLFGSRIVFPGIADLETLKTISAVVGLWDRPYVTWTFGTDPVKERLTWPGSPTYSNRREPLLQEGDIANIPRGLALQIGGSEGPRLLEITPFFAARCWRNVVWEERWEEF